jgi:hypothetical protein
MKILKNLLTAVFAICILIKTNPSSAAVYSALSGETPVKTICIKNPNAGDVANFFASTKVLNFEIYKAGDKADLKKIITALKSDANVESVTEGVLTGDYQAITLVLKKEQKKEWFITTFKKAGLNTIKINNNPIVEEDKL